MCFSKYLSERVPKDEPNQAKDQIWTKYEGFHREWGVDKGGRGIVVQGEHDVFGVPLATEGTTAAMEVLTKMVVTETWVRDFKQLNRWQNRTQKVISSEKVEFRV